MGAPRPGVAALTTARRRNPRTRPGNLPNRCRPLRDDPRARRVMIGDDLTLDVTGGHAAGLRTIWLQPRPRRSELTTGAPPPNARHDWRITAAQTLWPLHVALESDEVGQHGIGVAFEIL